MSQRKAKEYRRAVEQYQGVAADVDDLKRRIGAMEARHRREDYEKVVEMHLRREAAKAQADLEWVKAMEKAAANRSAERRRNERRRRIARRRRIIALAGLAALLLAMIVVIATAHPGGPHKKQKIADASTNVLPAIVVIEEPDEKKALETKKDEKTLLASGYLSIAVPMSYEYQDYMRTYCAKYGCPYPLALAVAETESHFNMDAVGAAGEVGIMQLNPGPGNAYWNDLEAETGLDPTSPHGNIAAGCYLLGKYMEEYGDPNRAAMAYNMGARGAENTWAAGIASTEYSASVMIAMERWEVTVNAWNGI